MADARLSVTLLAHTPEPVMKIALGARLCYSDSDIASLAEATKGREDKLVKKLYSLGHLAMFEHASFTFGIEGVSRSLLAQITRHRVASFAVQSQRYVKMDGADFVVPPAIEALGEEAINEYSAQLETMQGFYNHWLNLGIKAEDARFMLPNAAATRMLVTMNARELLHFLSLRCCERAQWEIRRLAWCMLGILLREAEPIFINAGPNCVCEKCSEGSMSCGNSAKMKELHASLLSLAQSGASDEKIISWTLENIR